MSGNVKFAASRNKLVRSMQFWRTSNRNSDFSGNYGGVVGAAEASSNPLYHSPPPGLGFAGPRVDDVGVLYGKKSHFDEDEGEESSGKKNCCRRTFCETRRRRLMCFTLSVFLLSLMTFFGIRVFQALDIVNTKPLFNTVGMNSLCDSNLQFSVNGVMQNPSAVGATLEPSSSKIITAEGVVAILNLPGFDLVSGDSDVDLVGSVEICDECVAPLRKTIQRWLDGNRIEYKVEVELTAGFDASVFLFPFSYTSSMMIESFLDPYVDLTLTYEQREAIALELAQKGFETLKTVQLVSADNSTVEGLLGLNMTSQETDAQKQKRLEQSTFGDWELMVEVPALTFTANIGDDLATIGVSQPFTYGKKDDLLMATAFLGWDNVAPINAALSKYQKQETIDFSVMGKYDASLLGPSAPATSECFLQTLIEGVYIGNQLEFFPSVIAYQEELAKDDPELIQVVGAKIDSVDENGVVQLRADLNLLGTQQFYGFQGEIPPMIHVQLSVNSSAPDVLENLGTLHLNSPINVTSEMNPVVSDVDVNIDLDNATLIVQFAEQATGFAGTDYSPFMFIRTVPDTLISALVSTFEFQFPFNVPEEVVSQQGRRALAESKASINFSIDVSTNYVQLDLTVTNLGRVDLFDYELVLDAIDFNLATYPFGNTNANMEDFFKFTTTPIDLSTNEYDNVTIGLRLFDGVHDGAMINDLIERIFENYEPIEFEIYGMYGSLVTLERSRNVFRKAEWQSTSTSSDNGFFSMKHIELDGITDGNIKLKAAFGIDVASLNAEITLPDINIGVADCTNSQDPKFLVALETQSTNFLIGASDEELKEVPVSISFAHTDSVDVLNAAGRLLNGNVSQVCVVKHPSSSNFFSSLIAALGVSFTVDGLEESTGPNNSTSFDLVIGESSICSTIQIDLNDFLAEANTTTSIGFGAFDMDMTDLGNDLLLSFSTSDPVFLGDCSSFWATPVDCERTKLDFSACLKTDNPNVSLGAQAIGAFIKATFMDETAFGVKLGGSIGDRRNAPTTTAIGAEFVIPADAKTTILGASSGEESSEFVSVDHLELLNIVSDDIRLQTAFTIDLEQLTVSTDLPSIGVTISDCTNPSNEKQLATIITDTTQLTIGGTSNSQTTMNIDVGFQGIDALGLIETLSNVVNGTTTTSICVGDYSQSSNFVSKLLGNMGFSYDIVPGTSSSSSSSSSKGLGFDLEINVDDNSVCTDIALNVSSLLMENQMSLGVGAIDWALTETNSGNRVFAFSSKNQGATFIGDCSSTFATTNDCGKEIFSYSFCLETANPDRLAGGAFVGSVLKSLFVEETAVTFSLQGTTTDRRAGSSMVTASAFQIPANAYTTFAGSSNKGDSILALQHVELKNLVSDELQLETAFDVRIDDFSVSISTLPSIAVSVFECSTVSQEKLLLNLVTEDGATLSIGGGAGSAIGVDISFGNVIADELLDFVSSYVDGTQAKLCVGENPSLSNFLSSIITAFDLSFTLDASTASSAATGAGIELDIAVNDNSACSDISLNVSSNSEFTFGWSALDWQIIDVATSSQIFSISSSSTFAGPCSSTHATQPACGKDTATFNVCLETNNPDRAQGGAAVGAILKRVIVDELATSFQLQGNTIDRKSGAQSSTSASFQVPANAVSKFTTSTSSSESVLEMQHVELNNVLSSVVNLETAFRVNIDDFVIRASLPAVGVSVYDCTAATNKLLMNLKTTPTSNLDIGTTLPSALGVALDFINVDSTELLQFVSGFNSETKTLCVSSNPGFTNFLSSIITSFDLSFNMNPSTSTTEPMTLDLDVSIDDRSICSDIALNVSSIVDSGITVGMGRFAWGLSDVASSSRVFSVSSASNIFIGSCASSFASAGDCGKDMITLNFCVETDNTNRIEGGAVVGDILQKLVFDELEVAFTLGGNIFDRQSGAQVSSSAAFAVPNAALSTLSSSSSSSSSSSLAELQHVELKSIVSGTINLETAFSVALENSWTISATLPQIGVSILDCPNGVDQPMTRVVNLVTMSGTNLEVGPNKDATTVGVGFTFDNVASNDLLTFLDRYMDGNSTMLCVGENPTYANFLSSIITSFDLEFALNGSSSASTSSQTPLAVDVTIDDKSVCAGVATQVNTTALGFTLGFGAIDMNVVDATSGSVVMSFITGADFFGSCSSPFASAGLCASDQLQFDACIRTDNANRDAGAQTVYGFLDNLSNNLAVPVAISGTIGERSTSTTVPITASFTIPENALSTFSSSSNDESSSSFALKHLEVDGIYGNDFRIGASVGLDLGLSATLNLPAIPFALYDCTGSLASMEILSTITTDATQITVDAKSEVTEEVVVSLGFFYTNSSDLLDAGARFVAGNATTVCIRKHPNTLNFLSNLIQAADYSTEFTGLTDDQIDDAQAVAGSSVLDLSIVTDANSVCTDISVNLTDANQAWNVSIGWGELEWGLKERTSNNLVFTWAAPSAFIGATCDSQFASVGHCEQNLIDVTFCFKTDNSNYDAGATTVREVIEAIVFDETVVPVALNGYSTNRRNPSQGQFPISGSFDIPANTLSTLSGTVQERSSFELSEWVKHFELLQLVDETLKVDVQAAEPTGVFDGVTLTLPPLAVRMFSDNAGLEQSMLTMTLNVPAESDRFQAEVDITLASWANLFDSLVLYRDVPAVEIKIGRVLTPPNFLHRIVPTFSLTADSGTTTTPTTVTKLLHFDLSSTSTSTSTNIQLTATSLNEGPSPVAIKWSADDITLHDGSASKNGMGTISLPAATFGTTGTATGLIDMTLSGIYAQNLATDLFKGNDVTLGLQSTTSSRISTSITVPKTLLEALALGTAGASTGASDAIDLNEVAIVGGDSVGSDIVLPCLVTAYCKNLLIDESTQTYTGMSLGLDFNLPDLDTDSSVSFVITLGSDLDIDVNANGLPIGELTIRSPFVLDSTKTGPGPANAYNGVIRFNWDPEDGVETARFTIDRISSSDSLVLSLNGAQSGTSSTYLSKLLSGIEQDVFIESQAADPNAPSTVGAIDLSVQSAIPTELTILAAAEVNYLDGENDIGVSVLLGEVDIDVYRNNQRVASAGIQSNQPDGRSFILEPTATMQTVNVVGKAYRDTANGPITAAMNDLVTKFVFSADIPLQIQAQFTPSSAFAKYNPACGVNPFSSGCTFSLTTWLTNPKVDEPSEFIDSFEVNLGSSAWDIVTSGDAQFTATKVLYNSLPFDIIVSYFQYKIVLYDTAGTYTEGHDAWFSGDCTAGFSPCNNNVPGFEYCYHPYDDTTYPGRKKNIIENDGLLQVGDSQRPANSLTGGALPSEGTGSVLITVNPLSEDMARLYEQYEYQKRLCADITNGRLVVGIQAGSCSDTSSTLVNNLQCTFPLDLEFEMLEYALLEFDTCRGPYGSQEDLNNPISINSGYDYQTTTNFFASSGSIKWSNQMVPIIDSFQIELTISFGSSGDDIEIVFSPDKSIQTAALQLLTRDCNTVKVKGATSYSRPVLYQSGEGKTTTVRLTYDAYTKRIRFAVLGGKGEYTDFDFDPKIDALANSNKAWIGIKHSTSSSSISTRTIRFSKVDGSKTTLVATDKGDNNINPMANEIGYLTFQTRDTQGRRKGTGRDSWSVSILSAATGSTATTNTLSKSQVQASACTGVTSSLITCTSAACICDLDNGTYRVAYSIPTKGRYIFSVQSSSVPTNPNVPVTITERVYIRENTL